jgi:hypothetical protein
MELLQCFTLFVSNTLCTQGCTKSSTTLVSSSSLLIVIEMTLFVNAFAIEFSIVPKKQKKQKKHYLSILVLDFYVTNPPHLVAWKLKHSLLGIRFH